MIERYRTIKENGQSEIEIKKSRFVCSLKRIESEEEAKNFIQEIKKNIGKQTITAVPSSLAKKMRSNEAAMMANQVERRAYRCWKSSKKSTDQCSCSSHSIFWRNETRHGRIDTSIHSCGLSSIVRHWNRRRYLATGDLHRDHVSATRKITKLS